MAAVDPFLYVAFAAGWIAGRLRPVRSPWVGRLTFAAVAALIFFLGASFRGVPLGELVGVLPSALAFALLILGATAGAFLALRGRGTPASGPSAPVRSERVPSSAIFLAALLVGVGAGRLYALPADLLVRAALYLLLALVAFGLELRWEGLRTAWIPVTASLAGAALASAVFTVVVGNGRTVPLATAFAFGWYSLAGPLVASAAGAVFGLFAFLTNFVRELLTMLLAPSLGRRLRGEGVAALGGATAMDTTLYFVVRYGDARAGTVGLASGLALTLLASLAVPLLLAV